MKEELQIRLAGVKDIEEMANLISMVFLLEKDFSIDIEKQRQGLALFLKDTETSCLLVAVINDAVVGMCSVQRLISTAEGGWKAIVEDVVVIEEQRGRGIGKRLLACAEKWARRRGVKRLDLLADRGNRKAIAFYERLDWKKTNLVAMQKKNAN